MRVIFDVVKKCLMSAKAFVHTLALTKHPITLSNIDIISYIKKKYLSTINNIKIQTPVYSHNFHNFYPILIFFFSKCASQKMQATKTKLVVVAQFVYK